MKLLQAFASGIPVVATGIGAEGIARQDGESCCLADDPVTFAEKVLFLFSHSDAAMDMAARARKEVVANWNIATIGRKLEASYREVLREKRVASTP